MHHYHTVSDAVSDLQSRGFSLDFSLIGNRLLCAQEKCFVGFNEFEVLEMHTIHTPDDTRKETTVYAIASICDPLKGILLNSGCHCKTDLPFNYRPDRY